MAEQSKEKDSITNYGGSVFWGEDGNRVEILSPEAFAEFKTLSAKTVKDDDPALHGLLRAFGHKPSVDLSSLIPTEWEFIDSVHNHQIPRH